MHLQNEEPLCQRLKLKLKYLNAFFAGNIVSVAGIERNLQGNLEKELTASGMKINKNTTQ